MFMYYSYGFVSDLDNDKWSLISIHLDIYSFQMVGHWMVKPKFVNLSLHFVKLNLLPVTTKLRYLVHYKFYKFKILSSYLRVNKMVFCFVKGSWARGKLN